MKQRKSQQQRQQGSRITVSQEVHREALRVAKNLMKLPPAPLKKRQ